MNCAGFDGAKRSACKLEADFQVIGRYSDKVCCAAHLADTVQEMSYDGISDELRGLVGPVNVIVHTFDDEGCLS